jgi:hypothetical protein
MSSSGPKCQPGFRFSASRVETDKFVAHLYQARKQYRLVCERPNKGNKAIDREVLSSYQVAQSLGFHGDFRAWEHLAADS